MFKKDIDTREMIHEIIASRWSGRAFDRNRQVTHEHIISLLEAARWAPSCYGEEPWRFIVCDKTFNETAWNKAFSCLSEGNQSWAVNAPVLIYALANTKFTHNGKHNRWSEYDTGAASMSLCIQAAALDLMVHQMGGFDTEKSEKLFSIPDQFVSMSIIAVGYQLPKVDIAEEIQERETSARHRKPLAEQFFDGEWGIAIR